MTNQKAMKLALEALHLVNLEFVCDGAHHAKKDRHGLGDDCPITARYQFAIKALEEALAKQEQGEPVGEAYLCDQCSTPFDGAWECPSCGHNTSTKEPVYTTPQQRKPLTDEQVMDAYCETPPFGTYKEAFIAGIRFIEAAHGIKE